MIRVIKWPETLKYQTKRINHKKEISESEMTFWPMRERSLKGINAVNHPWFYFYLSLKKKRTTFTPSNDTELFNKANIDFFSDGVLKLSTQIKDLDEDISTSSSDRQSSWSAIHKLSVINPHLLAKTSGGLWPLLIKARGRPELQLQADDER